MPGAGGNLFDCSPLPHADARSVSASSTKSGRDDIDGWLRNWQERLECDPQTIAERVASMRAVNPTVVPRNHRVEAALNAAESGDYSPFHRLLGILQRPYDDQPEVGDYSLPPQPSERVLQTFCGT